MAKEAEARSNAERVAFACKLVEFAEAINYQSSRTPVAINDFKAQAGQLKEMAKVGC